MRSFGETFWGVSADTSDASPPARTLAPKKCRLEVRMSGLLFRLRYTITDYGTHCGHDHRNQYPHPHRSDLRSLAVGYRNRTRRRALVRPRVGIKRATGALVRRFLRYDHRARRAAG